MTIRISRFYNEISGIKAVNSFTHIKTKTAQFALGRSVHLMSKNVWLVKEYFKAFS